MIDLTMFSLRNENTRKYKEERRRLGKRNYRRNIVVKVSGTRVTGEEYQWCWDNCQEEYEVDMFAGEIKFKSSSDAALFRLRFA